MPAIAPVDDDGVQFGTIWRAVLAAEQRNGTRAILRYPDAELELATGTIESETLSLLRRAHAPARRLAPIGGDAFPVFIDEPQLRLGSRVTGLRSLAVPLRRLALRHRAAEAQPQQGPERHLGGRITLFGGLTVERAGPWIVPGLVGRVGHPRRRPRPRLWLVLPLRRRSSWAPACA